MLGCKHTTNLPLPISCRRPSPSLPARARQDTRRHVVVYVVIICHMFEPLREMEEDDWEDEEDEPEDAQLRGIAGRKG